MTLKLRILLPNNEIISSASSTEELLKALLDVDKGLNVLNREEDDTLRGWLLMRAGELENGELLSLEGQSSVCIGKDKNGRSFVRDTHGEWPLLKPDFD